MPMAASNVRIVRLGAITLLTIVATATVAQARGGHAGTGFTHHHAFSHHRAFSHHIPTAAQRLARARIIGDRFNASRDFDRGRIAPRNFGSAVAWPYLWPVDPFWGSTALAGSDAPSTLPVVVVPSSPETPPQQTAQATPPDFSYVAGCRAIPGGFHCDPQQRSASPP
jgi:hypothetical protein